MQTTDLLTEEKPFQAQMMAVVSSAHAMNDAYTGFLPALLPVLIQNFSLSNTVAGVLSLLTQIPSILQPLIGSLADRTNLRLFIILSPALSGIASSLLGVAPRLEFMIFLLVLLGISSASLHAVGPVVGSGFAGSKLGRGMSFWMVGGELGRSLGPVLVVTVISYFGTQGLPWLMLAGMLVSGFLYLKLGSVETQTKTHPDHHRQKAALKSLRVVLLPLSGAILARSLSVATMTVFLPTYMTDAGTSLWMAGASLTILQLSGVAGAFLSGSLSDRFGRRALLLVSYAATPLFYLLLLHSKGLWQVPLLMLTGFFGVSVIPVFMAVVLENFPENRSLANGLYMAVFFVINALGVMTAGRLGDLVGLRATFLLSAALIPLGLPFILLLPKNR